MIKLENINKIYKNGDITVHALKNINLHIKEGEFTAIMGQSGSGKSTMMNILGCLDLLSSGAFYLDGVAIDTLNDNELAEIRNKKIGFIFQSFNLLPKLSAIENVELPMAYGRVHPKERRIKALEALKKVGLEERKDHKPNELSGGQRQRVAIARAIASNPAILLADEPTGNLDSKSEEEVMEIFKSLNKEGVTIVVVTHEPNIGKECNRRVIFKDGEIISDIHSEGVGY